MSFIYFLLHFIRTLSGNFKIPESVTQHRHLESIFMATNRGGLPKNHFFFQCIWFDPSSRPAGLHSLEPYNFIYLHTAGLLPMEGQVPGVAFVTLRHSVQCTF
jgi:hypothetical protein